MKTYSLTFDGSGTDEKVLPQGTYVRILETSSAISIIAEEGGRVIADLANVQQGLAWESEDKGKNLVPFTRVRVTSAAAQTVKLAVGYGRVLNDATSGNVTATLVKPTTLSDVADVALAAAATTLILAADSTRRSALIGNLAANTKTFRIGTVNAGAARGAELAPGKSLEIEGTAAIYGYNPAGAIESVSVLVVKD